MPSSSVRQSSKRRSQTLRRVMPESQLQAYLLARETLRRLRSLAAQGGVDKAPQREPLSGGS
jgi:hypothetical protein